jgi:hypothetical protein
MGFIQTNNIKWRYGIAWSPLSFRAVGNSELPKRVPRRGVLNESSYQKVELPLIAGGGKLGSMPRSARQLRPSYSTTFLFYLALRLLDVWKASKFLIVAAKSV